MTRRGSGRRVKATGEGRLPGDLSPEALVRRMIRVDHAGEDGAVRIYEGQLAVLGDSPTAEAVREMAAQERAHLETFERLMVERRVRPTVLSPLWHVAGFALGAGTALMGARAAMACTVAVEEVIEAHYAKQAESLGEDEAALKARLAGAEAVAIIKVGRHFAKVRRVLNELGLVGQARYVEHATMDSQRILPLDAVAEDSVPYFSMILVHKRGEAWT